MCVFLLLLFLLCQEQELRKYLDTFTLADFYDEGWSTFQICRRFREKTTVS